MPVVDAAIGVSGLAFNLGHVFGNLAGPISGAVTAALLTGGKPPFDSKPLTLARLARCAPPSPERPW
jgi:glycine/D-amino acid oxidase-like deaminating enzyme